MSARRFRPGRTVVLAVAAIYFFGPLLAALWFSVHAPRSHGIDFSAYKDIFQTSGIGQVGIGSALTFSLLVAAGAILITLVVMVPTQILLHLSLPTARPVVEVVCLLPLVFPPIVLAAGVTSVYQWAQPEGQSGGSALFRLLVWLRADSHPVLLCLLYVVMALPFVYRTIDAGLRAIDVRTLTEAARGLGASWWTTITQVLVAGLRTSLVNASFLVFALVMGEYTVSSILLYTKPFPIWLEDLPTASGQVQAAVSVLGLVLVEAMLLLLVGVMSVRGRRASTPNVAAGSVPAAELTHDVKEFA